MPDPGSLLPQSVHGKSAFDVAVHAAREAGKILKKRSGLRNKTESKGKRNLVTEVDLLSEKKILEIIRAGFPEHSILSEEAGAVKAKSEFKWVIDPLDGTNNYYFGIPFYCVNIALARRDEPILGLTYDPLREELYSAVKGQGAYLDGKEIRVSGVRSLGKASAGVDLGYQPERSRELLDIAVRLWAEVHCLRILGSSSLGLAYVACGRLGIYFHKYLYPWDVAAGLLLVREAGGEVTDYAGKPAGIHDEAIIAGNGTLTGLFRKWLAK